MYAFILNMWILRKVEEDFVIAQQLRRRITESEKDTILATPRICATDSNDYGRGGIGDG